MNKKPKDCMYWDDGKMTLWDWVLIIVIIEVFAIMAWFIV